MIDFKDKEDMKLFFLLHPILQLIIIDGANWAHDRDLNYIITDTVSTEAEDIKLGRVSKSHRQKRACDVGCRGWSLRDIIELKEYLTNKYGHYGAMSYTGKINLVIVHDSGHGKHFHIQIHSRYKL